MNFCRPFRYFDFLLRQGSGGYGSFIGVVEKTQSISADTTPVDSSSPPRFLKTLKMRTMEPFLTT